MAGRLLRIRRQRGVQYWTCLASVFRTLPVSLSTSKAVLKMKFNFHLKALFSLIFFALMDFSRCIVTDWSQCIALNIVLAIQSYSVYNRVMDLIIRYGEACMMKQSFLSSSVCWLFSLSAPDNIQWALRVCLAISQSPMSFDGALYKTQTQE